jgi:hypothetical protein
VGVVYHDERADIALGERARASLTVWSGRIVITQPPLLAKTFAMFT